MVADLLNGNKENNKGISNNCPLNEILRSSKKRTVVK
jgi:hypothetical protein